MFNDFFTTVAQEFTSARFGREYQSARKEYEQEVGRIFEDDPLFESKITGFLEWYIIERKLFDVGMPPLHLYFVEKQKRMTESQQQGLKAWQESERSLYQIKNIKAKRFKNLLMDGEKFEVPDINLVGFKEKQVIDARKIIWEGRTYFSEAIFAHDQDASKCIGKLLKSVTPLTHEERLTLVLKCAHLHGKRTLYPHLPVNEVYQIKA